MKRIFIFLSCVGLFAFPAVLHAATFADVTSKTYEYSAINSVIAHGWMNPLSDTVFGYGTSISPQDWLNMLMFLRTSDACPELGSSPNQYWTQDNVRNCLAGSGIPVQTTSTTSLRRDEAMQQLFALRRMSFAFQQLQNEPAGYSEPSDLSLIQENRKGAMIAADRLKLLFRSNNQILPASPLLREDAALAVWRFHQWENQGGVDGETYDVTDLMKDATLDHWRDLDTDIYVIRVQSGGDAFLRPILPYRSYDPKPGTSTKGVRDEFVYERVSDLAKESGAIAAVNGSYFNTDWPWGALEDVAMVDGKTIYARTDRSTFVTCKDGKMFVGTYTTANLKAIACTPQQALGAGPLFMQNGSVLTQNTKEGFDEYTQWQRRVGNDARTAIAVSKDRKTAYLISVAGKSYPAFGKGGNTLGTFLLSKYPDIGNAMMFDGGSSAALYANGSLLVAAGVSGGSAERAVVSALGVFSKKAEAKALASYKKIQLAFWDGSLTQIKIKKPSKSLAWQTVAQAKKKGMQIAVASSRGSKITIVDAKKHTTTFNMTFDLVYQDVATSSRLIVTRRQGTHENGWNIPTELHVIDPKDSSDMDIIKQFAYIPDNQKPDLKTFDVVAFRPSGIVFGDATGRYWFYYAKDKQLSPAKFRK